jgi:phage terminase small subunit
MAERPLTPKEEAFCREYIVDKNGTAAVLRAGYRQTPTAAATTAVRLLRKANIQARTKALLDKQAERTEITADRILRALLNMAEFDLEQLYEETPEGTRRLKPMKDWPKGWGKVAKGIKVREEWDGNGRDREKIGEVTEIEIESRKPSWELLGKHLRLWVERLEVTDKTGLAERMRKARARLEAKQK